MHSVHAVDPAARVGRTPRQTGCQAVTAEPRTLHKVTGRLHTGNSLESLTAATLPQPHLSTGLLGPLPLRFEHIRSAIASTMPGVFALGCTTAGGDGFGVLLVGRSDTDIGSKLLNYIGTYAHFKYAVFANSALAFEKECDLFHDFSPPNNRRHPERTARSMWMCPRCRQYGW
jgi:hypothetical protein